MQPGPVGRARVRACGPRGPRLFHPTTSGRHVSAGRYLEEITSEIGLWVSASDLRQTETWQRRSGVNQGFPLARRVRGSRDYLVTDTWTWRRQRASTRKERARCRLTSRSAATTATRPFRVEVQEEQLADLRHRVGSMRWPSKELVTDRSQGVQLATIQELVRYWGTDYDWHRCAARAQRTAAVQDRDGRRGHPLHPCEVTAPRGAAAHHDARLARIGRRVTGDRGPLSDPTAHGGRPEDAFDLVLPSLPGYGFSGEPTESRLGRRAH